MAICFTTGPYEYVLLNLVCKVTSLICAAENGHIEVVNLLLKPEIKFKTRNQAGDPTSRQITREL
jgi:hypothetical protein